MLLFPFTHSGKLFTESSKKKNWNVGDILGRSKDGFQPVNTDEREGMLGDDSDSEVKQSSLIRVWRGSDSRLAERQARD